MIIIVSLSYIWWHMGSGCSNVMMNVMQSTWDYISTLRNILNGSIDICVMRFGSACMKGTSPNHFCFCWVPSFFLYIDKYNDVGYIQWYMMIPSIRTHYVHTHGTYEWWDYICKFKYENVVDDILTESVILFVSLSYMMTCGIRM